MKLLFVSLGCDKNLVDTEFMLGMLRDDGIEITNDETEADIIIVNTCCFINDAKEETEIKGTPFAKYVITNLTGKADSKYLTITFTCAGAFDVNYQGRLIIEK